MKKLFFSFVMLVTLVIVAGSAKGQSNYKNAYVGATHEYTVGSLTQGDGWQFLVTADGVDLTDPAATTLADGGVFKINSGGSGTVAAAGTAIASITWNTAGTYRLWIKVQDNTPTAAGCYNYRYQKVIVTSYTVDFAVLALLTGDDHTNASEITGATGAASVSDCPKFVSEEFNNETSPTEGNTYVYFKVTRTTNPTSTGGSWKFTPSSTYTGATWDYSYDAASFGSTITVDGTTEFTATNGNDVVYVRATIPNSLAVAGQSINLNIGVNGTSSSAYDVSGHVNDKDNDDVQSTLTLKQLPTVGGFTGN